jgi:hypothetical protein
MIYLRAGQKHVVVLEPANMQGLTTGESVTSPGDADVLILYTPDAVWLAEQIVRAAKDMNPVTLEKLHRESMSRSAVVERDVHPMRQLIKNGEAKP